jgi:hypothetical protein
MRKAMEDSPVSTGQTACPSCGDVMERREFESRHGAPEAIDLCCPCRSIWFDQSESTQLAPRGVIELFGLIFKRQGEWRRPLASRLACPRCREALVFTHDLGKNGRFTYYRCEGGDGRLTPFTEFLREKQFVRVLAPAELVRVRAEVKQISCSGCGAAVDLARESVCSFCGAPIAILDAGAVEKALRQWTAEAVERDEQRARLAAMLSERMPELPGHCLQLGAGAGKPAGEADLIDGGITAVSLLLHGLGFKL